MARRIGGWNDFDHFAFEFTIAQGIDEHGNLLTLANILQVRFIHAGFEAKAGA